MSEATWGQPIWMRGSVAGNQASSNLRSVEMLCGKKWEELGGADLGMLIKVTFLLLLIESYWFLLCFELFWCVLTNFECTSMAPPTLPRWFHAYNHMDELLAYARSWCGERSSTLWTHLATRAPLRYLVVVPMWGRVNRWKQDKGSQKKMSCCLVHLRVVPPVQTQGMECGIPGFFKWNVTTAVASQSWGGSGKRTGGVPRRFLLATGYVAGVAWLCRERGIFEI